MKKKTVMIWYNFEGIYSHWKKMPEDITMKEIFQGEFKKRKNETCELKVWTTSKEKIQKRELKKEQMQKKSLKQNSDQQGEIVQGKKKKGFWNAKTREKEKTEKNRKDQLGSKAWMIKIGT